MTKQRPAAPEPTPDTRYNIYLSPHSKSPRREAFYNRLRALGWRFDTVESAWHTPADSVFQAHGRVSMNPDGTEAWIQPPRQGESLDLPAPILRMSFVLGAYDADTLGADGKWITEAEGEYPESQADDVKRVYRLMNALDVTLADLELYGLLEGKEGELVLSPEATFDTLTANGFGLDGDRRTIEHYIQATSDYVSEALEKRGLSKEEE